VNPLLGQQLRSGRVDCEPRRVNDRQQIFWQTEIQHSRIGLTFDYASAFVAQWIHSFVSCGCYWLRKMLATILGGGILARRRSGSQLSTASSSRPLSASSCMSGGSGESSNSSVSVRWDEAGLQTVKESRRMECESKSAVKKEKEKEKSKKRSKSGKEKSRKASDGRKRKPLVAIFPGTLSEREEEEAATNPVTPIVMIEEATIEGCSGDLLTETPVKRARSHPRSLVARDTRKSMMTGMVSNSALLTCDIPVIHEVARIYQHSKCTAVACPTGPSISLLHTAHCPSPPDTLSPARMRQARHPPIRLPQIAAIIVWLDGQASAFYRVCPPPHETTPLHYLRSTRSPSMSKGAFPHCTEIIGSSPVHICVHVGQQGHLR